jgi:hypothetical protein
MRLDLISPPRLDLLEAGVGRSAASWGITTGPKLRACLSNQRRLCCPRSVLNLLSRWSPLELRVGSRRLASVRGCLSARTGPTRYYEITDDEKVASRNRTEGAVAAKLKARQLLHYRPSTSIMYEPVTRVA